ncbi:MAG: polyphosphate polymerase domain-containing protein [bacterium]
MRLEYKYLVSNTDVDRLRNLMLPYLQGDFDYSPSNYYTVRSIYYDTPKLKYYWEKIEGLSTRKKVRLRGYNQLEEDNVVFLEIKRKHLSRIFKDRSPALYDNMDELMTTKNIDDLVITENGFRGSKEDAEKFFHHIHKRSLVPIVNIVYDREAYFSKFDKSLRITFDRNLRYQIFPSVDKLYDDEKLKPALINKTILEIKFGTGFPSWLQTILTNNHLFKQSLSKYTICIDTEKKYNPLLKANICLTNSISNNDYAGEVEVR